MAIARIYARETALKNVRGRSDYITNEQRQEHIIMKKSHMNYTWNDYVQFEKEHKKSVNENIQARETVIALPNDLSNNPNELEAFCDALGTALYGNNRDYEYAVHWNKDKTNLHVHFIYSERERNNERHPKLYKRDLWVDATTGKTCKKEHPNATLRLKKGEIQKDKEGNIKYEKANFSVKDKKYNNKNWLKERNLLIEGVFRRFKRRIDNFDPKRHIPQKKLYKGAKNDYIDYARVWNDNAKIENQKRYDEIVPLVRERNKLKPLMKEYLKYNQKEIQQAEWRLNVYNKNGYSGTHWNTFQRIKYIALKKYEDETNVNLYEQAREQLHDAINGDNPQSSYHVYDFKKYFNDVLNKIKKINSDFQKVKKEMTSKIGTIDKLKTYWQEIQEQELKSSKEREQQRQQEIEKQILKEQEKTKPRETKKSSQKNVTKRRRISR